MPRDLSKNSLNAISFFDKPSNSKIQFFYKNIKTDDRIKYKSAIVNALTKAKDPADVIEVQIEWAEKLIVGFRAGDFEVDGKPISSNQNDDNYYPGWKGLLKEEASDLLLLFVETILEQPNYVIKEDKLPFLENSKAS